MLNISDLLTGMNQKENDNWCNLFEIIARFIIFVTIITFTSKICKLIVWRISYWKKTHCLSATAIYRGFDSIKRNSEKKNEIGCKGNKSHLNIHSSIFIPNDESNHKIKHFSSFFLFWNILVNCFYVRWSTNTLNISIECYTILKLTVM